MTTRLFASVLLLSLTSPLFADFPPVGADVLALKQVPFDPGAAAVVIFDKGKIDFKDKTDMSSTLTREVRFKILTEAGKELGVVQIPHSRYVRLKDVVGQVTSPDGKITPLAKELIFEEQVSQAAKAYVTRLAFPNVEVGSIIDYRIRYLWDSFFYLDSWSFHSENLPVLLSEIEYQIPPSLQVQYWWRETTDQKMQKKETKSNRGTTYKASVQNLAGLPKENLSVPPVDIATLFMVIPTAIVWSNQLILLLDNWTEVCRDFQVGYKGAQKGRAAEQHAKTLVAAAGKDQRQKATLIFNYVRDEIRTKPGLGVFLTNRSTDEVFSEKAGDQSEKALLLQQMLDAVGIATKLVWAVDRDWGRIDLAIANPSYFSHILLRLELDGRELFLDPGDRSVAFGNVAPDLEGVQAIIFDKKRPIELVLPISPPEFSLRRAEVDMKVDAEGRATGTGKMKLEGHWAWLYLRGQDNAEDATKAWKTRLEERFKSFDVTEVAVKEEIATQSVELTWTLAQRAEAVLGDEASLGMSQPIAVDQPFLVPPERRLTPVRMQFGGRDEIVYRLSWPEGWSLEKAPKPIDHKNPVGSFKVTAGHDPAARTLVIERRFERAERELFGPEGYSKIRDLYEKASKHDAQDLVLVRD